MKNLLVVDDDYKMRSLLHETLSDRGYNVDVSKNGISAIKALKLEKYDLVISDLQMPKLNGIELLEIVKKQYPDVGFIILTGFGTIPLAVESLQKGAADFVTKPFSIPQIESKIK
ncbi:MAG: response regulator, partial [Candidatus Marinimicrobia bacterium]|nr:response regulator [Candidatus Neomarinimicrobiota bacterium]